MHLPVMKLNIHHVRGSLGSAVVYLCLAGKPAVSEINLQKRSIVMRQVICTYSYISSNLYCLSGRILMKRFTILRQVSYRMTIILFTVFTGNTCSAVSPLPYDFYAKFGGDPFTSDAPHDSFMRSVFFRMERP